MQVSLNSSKLHHESRYCLKCFKKFQLPLLSTILFKDVQICPLCTSVIEEQKKTLPKQVKPLRITDLYKLLKIKPQQRMQIFLPQAFTLTTEFCVVGYQGSLPLIQLQKFLSSCQKIKLHNIYDMKRHLSYLSQSISPSFNISFQNITRLQLKGQQIQSIEFLQYFDFRNLDDLSLWDNNIVELKSLNKCRFPKLREIHLSNMLINPSIGHNRISSINSLSRADFNRIQKISLGFRQSSSFQQYNVLLKVSSVNMKAIYLNYLQLIQFYDKSLHHKYKDIHVVSLNNCQYSNERRNL